MTALYWVVDCLATLVECIGCCAFTGIFVEKKNVKNGKSSKTGQNSEKNSGKNSGKRKNGESGKGSISKLNKNDNTTNGNRKNRGTVKSSGKRKVTSEKRYGTKSKRR